MLLGGLRDRTVEYTTWVWGFTQFAKSFYSNREFRSLNCSAVLIFRNPRKAICLPLKVLLGGLRDRTWGFTKFAKSFYSNREFRSLNCSAVLIFRNPRKAMFGPESASWGVAGSYSWVYTTWVWGFTKFAKSFYSNKEFRSLNCSAVLIFRNPRKAMFAPESASWGVTGSYSWVYDMGMGIH